VQFHLKDGKITNKCWIFLITKTCCFFQGTVIFGDRKQQSLLRWQGIVEIYLLKYPHSGGGYLWREKERKRRKILRRVCPAISLDSWVLSPWDGVEDSVAEARSGEPG